MDAEVACAAVSVSVNCCAAALPPIAQVGVKKRFGTARAGDVPGQMTRESWVPIPWAVAPPAVPDIGTADIASWPSCATHSPRNDDHEAIAPVAATASGRSGEHRTSAAAAAAIGAFAAATACASTSRPATAATASTGKVRKTKKRAVSVAAVRAGRSSSSASTTRIGRENAGASDSATGTARAAGSNRTAAGTTRHNQSSDRKRD